jgi:hypothetical protein
MSSSEIGNCTVTFSQNANDNYTSASVSQIISVYDKFFMNYLPLIFR